MGGPGVERDEAKEVVLTCAPGRLGGYRDTNETVGSEAHGGVLADAMGEEDAELGVEEAEGVDYS